jgi:hypothetical protein
MLTSFSRMGALASVLASALALSIPNADVTFDQVAKRAANSTSDRLVFCHFMMGIISGRTGSSDYDADMKAAKAAGIDAL